MAAFTLKELRARHNLTQKEVAKDLGVSVQTYNAWEKDISNVAICKVQALADYYGVDIEAISLACIDQERVVARPDSEQRTIGLNAEKFEFLLLALRELTEPLIGHEKFRVVVEKNPESHDVTVSYSFE